MKQTLGVDFGGVICPVHGIVTGSENSFENADPKALGYLSVRPFEGALETLRRLRDSHFPDIFLVSKISENLPGISIEERVRTYLYFHGFEEVILMSRMFFCEERAEKVAICTRQEILDCFLDDRLDVLRHMVGHVRNLFLFDPGRQEGHEHWSLVESGAVTAVRSWKEFRTRICQ